MKNETIKIPFYENEVYLNKLKYLDLKFYNKLINANKINIDWTKYQWNIDGEIIDMFIGDKKLSDCIIK